MEDQWGGIVWSFLVRLKWLQGDGSGGNHFQKVALKGIKGAQWTRCPRLQSKDSVSCSRVRQTRFTASASNANAYKFGPTRINEKISENSNNRCRSSTVFTRRRMSWMVTALPPGALRTRKTHGLTSYFVFLITYSSPANCEMATIFKIWSTLRIKFLDINGVSHCVLIFSDSLQSHLPVVFDASAKLRDVAQIHLVNVKATV